jgi:hypothetical protein
MADSNILIATDPVQQFSVFVENRVGRLHELTALLKSNDVHVMAITILDSTDSTIVRLVVDDPSKARELMVNNDFPYTECTVLAVEINDESELKGVLSALLEAEINIHYIYSFIKRPEGRGVEPRFLQQGEALGVGGGDGRCEVRQNLRHAVLAKSHRALRIAGRGQQVDGPTLLRRAGG